MTKHVLKPEEIDLFRQRVGDVRPLAQNTAEMPRPAPRKSRRSDLPETPGNTHQPSRSGLNPYESEGIIVSSDDFIQFRRPGIQDRVFRKLQRGQIEIAAELDLHGMTINRAKIALDQFMAQIQHTGRQICIRIIHGKGYGSKDGFPVIKRQTQQWLQCNISVLAYCSCRPSDGGTGAIYVLVKSIT
jgi:DNA-nicking Smr family endonuclease